MRKYAFNFFQFILLFSGISNCLKANNFLDSLKFQLRNTTDLEEQSRLCKVIGDTYYSISQDSIMMYYAAADKYAQRTTTHKDDVNILRSYGYYHTNLSNKYAEAISYYEKAIATSQQNNDERNVALIKNDLGIVSWKKGDFQSAIQSHFEAENIAAQLDDPDLRMRTLLSLGIIHNEGSRNEEAKTFYLKALPLADEVGHKRAKALILNNLGKVYRDLENYEASNNYFEQALSYFNDNKNNYWLGIIYYNLGKNSYLQNKFKRAIDNYEKALQLNSITQDKDRALMITAGLAEVYEASSQDDKAIKKARKGLKLLEKIDTKLYHQTLNLVLARCYKRKGNFKKSSFYFQQNITTMDGTYVRGTEQKLVKMKAIYENERKQAEINKLKIQNSEEMIKYQQDTYFFRISLVLCLFILAIMGLLFYRMKLRQLRKYNVLRTKLTNDLHDNIGSSLNQIKMLAGKINSTNSNEKINKIKLISNNLIYNMYDLIWSIDNDKTKIEDLIQHMNDHASNVFLPIDIPFRMRITNDQPQKIIDAEMKNNIYSVYKEAINNIVKHTRPSIVQIFIEVKNSKLQLKIQNDKNIVLDNQFSNKKGLKSMMNRTQTMGGKLNIKDQEDQFIINFQVSI